MRTLLLALLLGACGPTITLTDDIDLTWDWGPSLTRFENSLHSPYVQGTAMTVYVTTTDDHPNLSGWEIVSSHPEVFNVETITTDQYGAYAHGSALQSGTATLTVLDDHQHEVGSGDIEVAVPDRIELDAHGYLILDRDDEAPITDARIVAGGTATYMARYFNSGNELHGNGVLSAEAPAPLTATVLNTFLLEDREWLQITASTAGTAPMQLFADGVAVNNISVVTVPETDITGVALIAQPEDHHKDGDWLVDLAQAYDADGQRIFGVDYTWDVGGVAQDYPGDLYRYEYKSGDLQVVTATRGSLSDTTTIQSDAGFVDSTNNVGCAAGGGGSLGLVLLALAGLRRQRPQISASE